MPAVCFTTILVDDMEAALGFYVDKLGFEVVKRDHYPYFVMLKHDLYPIALHQVEKTAANDYPNQSQTILGIATENLAETIAKFKAQGVDVIHDTPKKFFLGWYAALRDPAGNVHELIEFAQ